MNAILSSIITRLRLAILHNTIDPTDPSSAFFAQERWNIPLLREYRRASQYRSSIDYTKVKRVFLFSYSRSGTHNFASKLHYQPSVFVVGENFFCSKDDPYQLKINTQKLKTRHFLALSTFAENGLQNKSGHMLRNLVLFNNKYLEHDTAIDTSVLRDSNDQIIYYVRNIFRTIYSRMMASQRVNRPKPQWIMNDDRFELILRQHREKIGEMLLLLDRHPNKVFWCFHEHFCAQQDSILEQLCDFLAIPEGARGPWNEPMQFFARCFESESSPTVKDGRLWCENRSQYISGTGGKYNPLPETTLARAMKDPIHDLITKPRLDIAHMLFGKSLVEFWLEDASFAYSNTTSDQLLGIIRDSLPSL